MKFGRGNYINQNAYVDGESCSSCYTQTFGHPLNPGYKCVDDLCGKLL